jgi:hypothetical protein
MAKTIIILGGAYAGVQVAHRLLKYTRPQVKDLKVILISKVCGENTGNPIRSRNIDGTGA